MNLQEKLSGLKGLVTHSGSKRRHKGDLTLDMISPPLGDFRHTMHVGRGGDVFGDTSFLSNHGGSAANHSTAGGGGGETESLSTPDNKIGAFFSKTLRQIRRSSTDSRPRDTPREALSPPPPAVSPIIKNAISLPRLDVDTANGSPTAKVLFPSSQCTPEEKKSSYGLESGFVTLPRLSRSERQQPSISFPTSCSPNIHRGSLTDPADAILTTRVPSPDAKPATRVYSDSLPSLTSLDTFTFDLGPSLMSEVFGLIDGHADEHGLAWEGEELGSACGMTNEGSEMDSATISYVDSLLREDCGSRRSPHTAEWEEEEEEEGGGATEVPVKVPDLALGSPERARMGMGMAMESERFRSATDVLARHYGGTFSKGQSRMGSEVIKKGVSYSYMDDEDEIKV